MRVINRIQCRFVNLRGRLLLRDDAVRPADFAALVLVFPALALVFGALALALVLGWAFDAAAVFLAPATAFLAPAGAGAGGLSLAEFRAGIEVNSMKGR